jgi:hypothetical protein
MNWRRSAMTFTRLASCVMVASLTSCIPSAYRSFEVKANIENPTSSPCALGLEVSLPDIVGTVLVAHGNSVDHTFYFSDTLGDVPAHIRADCLRTEGTGRARFLLEFRPYRLRVSGVPDVAHEVIAPAPTITELP